MDRIITSVEFANAVTSACRSSAIAVSAVGSMLFTSRPRARICWTAFGQLAVDLNAHQANPLVVAGDGARWAQQGGVVAGSSDQSGSVSSAASLAAVGREVHPRDERGFVRREEQRDVGDVLGQTEASEVQRPGGRIVALVVVHREVDALARKPRSTAVTCWASFSLSRRAVVRPSGAPSS